MEPQISRDTLSNTTDRSPYEYPTVAVSVVDMADLPAHLSYDELDTPSRLRADGAAAGRALRLDLIARAVAAGAPSLEYDAYPREVVKREIAVDEAAARLARAFYLD
jgi:hypothetical protein